MAVDKRCLACDTYRDDCTGNEEACKDWKPIDWQRAVLGVPLTAENFPSSPLTAENFTGKLIPSPLQESRRQKFARIGKKRQQQALEAIRKLEHLTSRYHRSRTDVTVYTYEWTAEEALELVKPITEALANLQAELIACDIPYEHGMIEETK